MSDGRLSATALAWCECRHQHETATPDGVVSVFHRCRVRGCDCNEFRPERPDTTGMTRLLDDAALGAALRAAVQQNDPGDYLIVLRREYTEGFDVYTHDRFADPRESDATRTLASLLSRAAQPAKEEG